MDVKSIIFFLLAAFILITAMLSVTERKIFRAAIYLLFSMMGIAGLYFWMNYEFIAAVQIVVYVGGIVVLIIFSVFLTHHAESDLMMPTYRRTLFTGLACVFAFTWFWVLIKRNNFFALWPEGDNVTVKQIGEQLLNYKEGGFVLPFEVVSMLLLAAMIGCIVIALKQPLTVSKEIEQGN